MPIYEYRCIRCGSKFELMRRLSDDDEGVTCPDCGAGEPEKVLSLFASGGGGSDDSGCAPAPSGG